MKSRTPLVATVLAIVALTLVLETVSFFTPRIRPSSQSTDLVFYNRAGEKVTVSNIENVTVKSNCVSKLEAALQAKYHEEVVIESLSAYPANMAFQDPAVVAIARRVSTGETFTVHGTSYGELEWDTLEDSLG